MSNGPETCPICKDFQDVSATLAFDGDGYTVTCPRCGRYSITQEGIDSLDTRAFRESAHLLSGVTRSASDRSAPLVVMRENLDQLLDAANPPRGVAEGATRLLQWVAQRSRKFGQGVEIHGAKDYPILFAHDAGEFEYFVDMLIQRGLIRAKGTMGAGYELTEAGWERLEALQVPVASGRKVFVAMWFAEELRSAYTDGIAAALEAAGYWPLRVDNVQFNERIDDRIIVEIRQSRFIVADCTGQRGGVYFEAGYALGLGLTVIWTCRENDVGNLHFDIRQYHLVVWRDARDLKEKLLARVLATVGPAGSQGGSA